jgi:hypothetical protein
MLEEAHNNLKIGEVYFCNSGSYTSDCVVKLLVKENSGHCRLEIVDLLRSFHRHEAAGIGQIWNGRTVWLSEVDKEYKMKVNPNILFRFYKKERGKK